MVRADIRKADLLVFFVLLGFGLTTSLLSIYFHNIGISLAGIGLIFSGGMIATGLMRIPIGTVVDRLGKKKFILIGVVGYPVFSAGVAFASSVQHFILLQILIGLFGAVFWTAFSSYFFDILSRGHEGVQIGGRNTVMYATSAFAPVLAGIIAGRLGFKALFLTGALVGAASILAAATIKDRSMGYKKIRLRDIRKEYKDVFKVKGYKTILLGVSLISVIVSLWIIFLPVWLRNQGFSLEAIGALLSANLLVGAILQVPLGRAIDKFPAKMLIVPAFFLMWIGGVLFFTFKNYFSYIVNRTFFGTASDAAYWPFTAMLAKITPKKEHGAAVAGLAALEKIIYGFTAFVGGVLSAVYGIENVLFGAAFLALGVGLALTYSRTLRQKGKFSYRKHHLGALYGRLHR